MTVIEIGDIIVSETRGQFEAAVDFGDKKFKLSGGLAGKVLAFKFKSQHYQIHFPNFDPVSDPKPFRSSLKPTRKNTKIGLNWIEGTRKNGNYGSGTNHSGNSVTEFSISTFIVRTNKPVTASIARKNKQELLLWRDIFTAWIEVLDYRDLENSSITVDQASSIEAYFIPSLKGSKARRVKKRNEASATIQLTNISTINTKVLRKALKHTELATYPPSYYSMLIRGLKHYNGKLYRESLFDTATAAEIALTEMLNRKLTITNPSQKKNLMKDARQLSGLTHALKITGESISPEIQSKIGTPRNKAIHEGIETTELQAREALATAKDLLRSKLPL